MILIIDLCRKPDSLSKTEFVNPVAEIVDSCGVIFKIMHYKEISCEDINKADGAILCGTALKDNEFLNDIKLFDWIKTINIPVMGVCAGIQVISGVFGGKVVKDKKIGMTKVSCVADDPVISKKEEFEAYELHNYSVTVPDCFIEIARSDDGIQAIKHKEKSVYGVVFHPEVRNEWVLKNFIISLI
ncbi:hypothetical protein F1737_05655 [Methanoplanus sp. FWC-SCC4]|uniref:anthranilate synthase n=1 Tax=Methanochimaera problematica TaxID=2609417 RepID=A0AA97I480_9EURY|nr:gamma-glutamyl-gamma-aminobutyrate hydrolase family protein [Methanoplanus sp. FWC-SCC4]WOF16229.1 hypothetical protein F1737_05655 [Methanoplanus sp. FWC-SCC4]